MEFPHLGQHCNEASCHRLDFLPMKCVACGKVFCSSHFRYERHRCASEGNRDHQVPLCPLCGEPVPTAPGDDPDRTVGQHIDQQCKSDSGKIFTNRCSFEKCKKKELIPFNCSQCQRNFCLRHRHIADHKCEGPKSVPLGLGLSKRGRDHDHEQRRTMAANAAKNRIQKGANLLPALFQNQRAKAVSAASSSKRLMANTSQARSLQGDMTDDEALARAIAESIIDLDERNQATANAAILNNNSTPRVPVGGSGSNSTEESPKDKCMLS